MSDSDVWHCLVVLAAYGTAILCLYRLSERSQAHIAAAAAAAAAVFAASTGGGDAGRRSDGGESEGQPHTRRPRPGRDVALAAVAIQYALIVIALFRTLFSDDESATVHLDSRLLVDAILTTLSLAIARAALPRDALSGTQALVLVLLFVPCQAVNLVLCTEALLVHDGGRALFVHVFGAYFGLSASTLVSMYGIEASGGTLNADAIAGDEEAALGASTLVPVGNSDDESSTDDRDFGSPGPWSGRRSTATPMGARQSRGSSGGATGRSFGGGGGGGGGGLGSGAGVGAPEAVLYATTVVLAVFLPTTNAAYASSPGMYARAVANTIVTVLNSVATRYLISLMRGRRGISAIDCLRAVVGGSVSAAAIADIAPSFAVPAVVGVVGALLLAFGDGFLSQWLERQFSIQDCIGVHAAHALNGLLGALAALFLVGFVFDPAAVEWSLVFGGGAKQGLHHWGGICFTLLISLFSGTFTGYLVLKMPKGD